LVRIFLHGGNALQQVKQAGGLAGANRHKGIPCCGMAMTQIGEDIPFQVSQTDMTGRGTACAAESEGDVPPRKALPSPDEAGRQIL